MLVFGGLQALSNLTFMLLAWTGKSYPIMVAALSHFKIYRGGMGTAAFVALMIDAGAITVYGDPICVALRDGGLGPVFAGSTVGLCRRGRRLGLFFFITFLAALPGLLWILREYFHSGRLQPVNDLSLQSEPA